MRVIVLSILSIIGACTAISEDDREAPIVYLVEINSFEYLENPGLREVERDGQIFLTISNGCGSYKAELEITESNIPLPEKIEISSTIGEWCRLKFTWPYDRYLIIAEGQPDNLIEVFKASSYEPIAYMTTGTELWDTDLKRWLGSQLVSALEPEALAQPLRMYLHELPEEFSKAYSYYDEELEEEFKLDAETKSALERVVTFDGPVAIIHKAVKLESVFPEMFEE